VRYLGIDLARSIAIIFVILGHALMGANVQDGAAVATLRFFLAISPPVFFCLFGCMLQLVYARQFASGRQREIVQRLLTRAVQCWALYTLTCAAMCLAAGLPFTYFIRCALFLGDTPFTDILKFYAALLLAAPVLVAVSVRHGIWPLVAVCLAIQAAFPLVSQLPPIQGFAGSETLSAFLYGGKYMGHTGPSVMHGLGFVVFGMVLGRIWQSRPGQEFLLSGPGWMLRAGFLAMLAATAIWIIAGGHNLLEPIERITLRNSNHPLYLLFGCTAAIVFIEVFSVLRRMAGLGAKSFWMIFGQTSLFTFCFGNILLYAVQLQDPAMLPDPARVVWSTLAALSLSILYYSFREGSWVKSDNLAARAYRWVADDSAAQLVRWATDPFLDHGPTAPKPLKPVDTPL